MTDVTNAPAPSTPSPRRSRALVLVPLLIFGVLAGIFMYKLLTGGGNSLVPSPLIGKPVPEFAMAPLEGLRRGGQQVPGLATADLNGPVSIVNVFASWCAPCRQEHPLLVDLAKDERVRVVGINYKDKPANALRFLGSLGNPYAAVGVDPVGRAAIDWGVYGVPETFIVAPDGTIAYKFIGPLSEQSYRERFLPELEKVIAASGGS